MREITAAWGTAEVRPKRPSVLDEVRSTRRTCLLHRWMAVDLYLREIEALRDELSLSTASADLRHLSGDAREPYREVLRGVRTRLIATRDWLDASLPLRSAADLPAPADAYLHADEFAEVLDA